MRALDPGLAGTLTAVPTPIDLIVEDVIVGGVT